MVNSLKVSLNQKVKAEGCESLMYGNEPTAAEGGPELRGSVIECECGGPCGYRDQDCGLCEGGVELAPASSGGGGGGVCNRRGVVFVMSAPAGRMAGAGGAGGPPQGAGGGGAGSGPQGVAGGRAPGLPVAGGVQQQPDQHQQQRAQQQQQQQHQAEQQAAAKEQPLEVQAQESIESLLSSYEGILAHARSFTSAADAQGDVSLELHTSKLTQASETLLQIVSSLKVSVVANNVPATNHRVDKRIKEMKAAEQERQQALVSLGDEVSRLLVELEDNYYSTP